MLGVAILAQLAIVANGPDTATACLPLRVSAAIRTPGRSRAGHRAAAGIRIATAAKSRQLARGVGRRSAFSTITEAWADVAISPVGRIQLPPFVAVVDGKRISSNPIVVNVREPISPPPIVLVDARLDDAHGVESRDSLFVGQQVDYRVDVLLNETARTRLRRNPTFFPPEMSAVLAYDVDIPRGMPKQGRRCFETLSYRRGLFPLFPGNVTIPPAVLTYSLPLTSSFFSREESFELRSDSVRFVAIDPPARDRPADYAGAVGTLRISARTETGATRVGDPVVLMVRVTGGRQREAAPASVARAAVGDDHAGRRARGDRLDRDADQRRQGVRVADHAARGRHAGGSVDTLSVLRPGDPSVCGDRDVTHPARGRRRVARLERYGDRHASADPRRAASRAPGAPHVPPAVLGAVRARSPSCRAATRRTSSPARHQRVERGATDARDRRRALARAGARAAPALPRRAAGARAERGPRSRAARADAAASRRERRRRPRGRVDAGAARRRRLLGYRRARRPCAARIGGDRRDGR